MATFDQLSAEQRAIIELILRQGKTYEGLGEMLGMPTARVKELARGALVSLAPVSAEGVDKEWRGQVADYLLQQQSGPEATATRGHLRRSEGARAWSRSVLDSLDQFYDPANLPTIPAGEDSAPSRSGPSWRPERREKPSAEDSEPGEPGKPAPKELSPEAKAVVRRRQVAGAAGLGLVALLAVLVWPGGLATGGGGGDDEKEKPRRDRRPAARVLGQLELQPVEKAKGTGVAAIAARGKERQLVVQARLRPTRPGKEAYEVWLYNSDRDARSLGAQLTDRQGLFPVRATLPPAKEITRYAFIDVSRERLDRDKSHSGVSVLRGRIDQFRRPAAGAQQGGQGTAP